MEMLTPLVVYQLETTTILTGRKVAKMLTWYAQSKSSAYRSNLLTPTSSAKNQRKIQWFLQSCVTHEKDDQKKMLKSTLMSKHSESSPTHSVSTTDVYYMVLEL